jgi:hypothetical protein
LPGDVTSIVFTATFILFVAGEKRSHALNSGEAYAATSCEITRSGHSAPNALFASFLRR